MCVCLRLGRYSVVFDMYPQSIPSHTQTHPPKQSHLLGNLDARYDRGQKLTSLAEHPSRNRLTWRHFQTAALLKRYGMERIIFVFTSLLKPNMKAQSVASTRT